MSDFDEYLDEELAKIPAHKNTFDVAKKIPIFPDSVGNASLYRSPGAARRVCRQALRLAAKKMTGMYCGMIEASPDIFTQDFS